MFPCHLLCAALRTNCLGVTGPPRLGFLILSASKRTCQFVCLFLFANLSDNLRNCLHIFFCLLPPLLVLRFGGRRPALYRGFSRGIFKNNDTKFSFFLPSLPTQDDGSRAVVCACNGLVARLRVFHAQYPLVCSLLDWLFWCIKYPLSQNDVDVECCLISNAI